jgi:hypothetical protein
MSVEELIDRLKYRFNDYWYSEKRSVKLLARALAFTLFAAVVSTIAPTLADELSSDPQMLEPVVQTSDSTTSTITIAETVTPTPSATATFTPDPVVSRPPVANPSESALPESSDSATVDLPGAPLEIQPKYIVKVPSTGALDPRATTYFLPHIYAASMDPDTQYSMICINGTSGTRFDALQKGVPNNSVEGNELVAGDQTGMLVISAETNRAVNLFNSYNGMFLTTWGGGLSGRSLTIRIVAVTKPVANPEFCSAAKSGAVMTLRPLGLDLSTVKGGGVLK